MSFTRKKKVKIERKFICSQNKLKKVNAKNSNKKISVNSTLICSKNLGNKSMQNAASTWRPEL